jgi:hypothetical protein
MECRSPFEKSQFLPDRNVTARPVDMTLRFRGTRPPRNGITAKPGEGEGVKGRSRLAGARSAALEAVVLTQHHQAAVRTGRTTACRQSRR